MKALDLTNNKFGRLTALEFSHKQGKKRVWKCLCECGNISYAIVSDLTAGKHKSCGCLHKEAITIHGFSSIKGNTPTYRSWQSMKARCNNPKSTGYHRYGGRGITYCKEWDSFERFLKDMGERPSIKHTLDRVDNDGSYCKKNCKWSTRKEQAQNRHHNPSSAWSGLRDEKGRFSAIS